jgi:hypothetical protein
MPAARDTNEVLVFLGPLAIALLCFGLLYRSALVEVVLSAFR